MAGDTQTQKRIVGRVMHAFKEGTLRVKNGPKVERRQQAIAIALREAGASNAETPKKNRANIRKTKARTRVTSGQTRAELVAKARARHIKGRSSMTKAELQTALR